MKYPEFDPKVTLNFPKVGVWLEIAPHFVLQKHLYAVPGLARARKIRHYQATDFEKMKEL